MATSEEGLWEWLRDVVLPLGHYSRIESPTSPGFPDVHYIIPEEEHILIEGKHSHTGVIELKHSRHLDIGAPFPDEDTGLHQTQRIWIRNATRNNGVVWVFAEVTPYVYLIPGKRAHRFNGALKKELKKISTDVIDIREPEAAAETVNRILTIPLHILEKRHGK